MLNLLSEVGKPEENEKHSQNTFTPHTHSHKHKLVMLENWNTRAGN